MPTYTMQGGPHDGQTANFPAGQFSDDDIVALNQKSLVEPENGWSPESVYLIKGNALIYSPEATRERAALVATDPQQAATVNPSPRAERNAILLRALLSRSEAKDLIATVEHWNEHVRKSHEERIDPDPSGDLAMVIQAVEKMAETELWAVHAVGPDEYYAAPSLAAAERMIADTVKVIACLSTANNPNNPPFGMYVVPWPGTPEEHDAELRSWNTTPLI